MERMSIRENEDMILMFEGAINIQREIIAQAERTIGHYQSAINEINGQIKAEMAELNIIEAEVIH